MPVLLEHFPKDVETFYDVFAGGLSVTVNCDYENIVSNDIIKPMVEFYEIIQRYGNVEDLIQMVKNSAISKTDQDEYYRVREAFNKTQNPYLFFSLVSSCMNNMMRFNKKSKFNQSFGKRTVNKSTITKLRDYHRIIHEKDILFTNYDYVEFLTKLEIGPGDFVYLDPPYSITDPGYGTYRLWNNEIMLYSMLEMLNANGVRFMMSNVREHNGKVNPYLDKLNGYEIIDLDFDYEKVARKKGKVTKEMIVKNF